MDWNQHVETITPHIVKIETPQGHGTGFLCLYNEDESLMGIATAYHVVEHADKWQQPMRIYHEYSGEIVFLKESDRFILCDTSTDSAVILFLASQLILPREPVELLPVETRLPIGVEVGWLGYPGIGPQELCFFSGNVSARVDRRHLYLIDGVAIGGVSGGPVLYATTTDGVNILQIVGTISAYIVNRSTGEALPGLSMAQDVSHFHAMVSHVRSLDEARRQSAQVAQPEQETAVLPNPASENPDPQA
jgi:hypothetical protein